MKIEEIASAIYNHVVSGLRGYHSTPTISLEQLEDEVIEERLAITREWYLRGILNRKDMLLSINCIEVDCKDTARCCAIELGKKGLHFEIPQLLNELGLKAIEFVGSVDREVQYRVYNSTSYQFHKYRKRSTNDPYVYIETTPNENGKYDGWIFNVPYVKYISVIGVFKDPRQLLEYNCCNENTFLDLSGMSSEVEKRLTERYLRYYRSFLSPQLPNTNTPT